MGVKSMTGNTGVPGSQPQIVIIDTGQLQRAGFTASGTKHFDDTVIDYSKTLFKKSRGLGEVNKAENMSAEITHENVRAAAFSIARSYGTPQKHWILKVTQIGEYICAGVAGAGAGHLDKTPGMVAFTASLVLGALLMVVRLSRRGE